RGLPVLPAAVRAEHERARQVVEGLVVVGRVGKSPNDVVEDADGRRRISRPELGIRVLDEPGGLQGGRQGPPRPGAAAREHRQRDEQGHASHDSGASRGSVNPKQLPSRSLDSTHARPPCARTKPLTIVRPRPVPPRSEWACSYRSKIVAWRCAGMPIPMSDTVTVTWWPMTSPLTPMTPAAGLNFTAFARRFTST